MIFVLICFNNNINFIYSSGLPRFQEQAARSQRIIMGQQPTTCTGDKHKSKQVYPCAFQNCRRGKDGPKIICNKCDKNDPRGTMNRYCMQCFIMVKADMEEEEDE